MFRPFFCIGHQFNKLSFHRVQLFLCCYSNDELLLILCVVLFTSLIKKTIHIKSFCVGILFTEPFECLEILVPSDAFIICASLWLTLFLSFALRQMKKYIIDNCFVMIFVSGVARIVGDLLFFTLQNFAMFQ